MLGRGRCRRRRQFEHCPCRACVWQRYDQDRIGRLRRSRHGRRHPSVEHDDQDRHQSQRRSQAGGDGRRVRRSLAGRVSRRSKGTHGEHRRCARRSASSSASTPTSRCSTSDVDLVILATPPGFRPLHFEAAVNAGKHVFMEKPVAVDAPGVRRVLAANEDAKEKNLQGRRRPAAPPRRRSTSRRSSASRTARSATSSLPRVYWNGGGVWVRPRQRRPDRDGVPDAQLVLLQLALRRPHRRAAHPQPGRQQLAA